MQALNTRAQEIAYEKSLQQSEVVFHIEKTRQFRLQILLLEDRNEDLHAQLSTDDECIEELMNYCKDVEARLELAVDSLQSTQSDLRVKSREVETLKVGKDPKLRCANGMLIISKVELSSLHGVTMNSTKLLTEKLTLARELSTLRPEVEHLRTQAASQQSLLAEKLSFQRQLSTCQVELETERRSTQRNLAKEGRLQAQDSIYESKLEQLQAEVAKERSERQKVERQVQKTMSELENENATFESRLDSLKNKLRLAKDQLKEEQTKKLNVHTTAQATAGSLDAIGVGKTTARNSRKRNAAQMDSDTMIGTPGLPPVTKKSKRGSTLPGDKSTFSITPFLNRTASVGPDSPIGEPSNSDRDEELQKINDPPNGLQSLKGSSSAADSHKAPITNYASKYAPVRKSGLTGKSKSANTDIGAPLNRKKPQTTPSLEQVAEENDEETGSVAIARPTVAENAISDDTASGDVEVKRRKRKILGEGPSETLFDEDDGEAFKGDRELLGGARNLGTVGRLTLGGPKLGARVRLRPAKGEFGTISPLKRDRKATVAKI